MYILRLAFIERRDVNRGRNAKYIPTQIEAASSLNEEFDLVTLRKSIIRWCQLILSNKAMALIGVIELLKQAKNRKLQLLTLSAVNGFFEDIMHAKIEMDNYYTFSDLTEEIENYANQLTFNQLILMYDQLLKRIKLNQNVNPTLVFEQIVIKGVI